MPVSKAASNFPSCLRRVYNRHEALELVENGIPYARLIPVEKVHGNSHDMADALKSATLRSEDARGWGAAVREGRKHLKPLKNPWG
jgi:hypothetical protein